MFILFIIRKYSADIVRMLPQPTMVLRRGSEIFILLGKFEERLSQGEYMDVCVRTGFHGMNRV